MKKVILTNQPSLLEIIKPEEPLYPSLNEILRDRLLKGIVHFSFQKKDGSLREAYGTLQQDKITIPAGDSKPNEAIGTYFDLEANAWRSYTIANLVAVY